MALGDLIKDIFDMMFGNKKITGNVIGSSYQSDLAIIAVILIILIVAFLLIRRKRNKKLKKNQKGKKSNL